jgi:hypothetical protein
MQSHILFIGKRTKLGRRMLAELRLSRSESEPSIVTPVFIVLVPVWRHPNGSREEFLARLLEWLLAHIGDRKISVRQAAWEMGYCRAVLQRKTMQEFGLSFMRFCRQFRARYHADREASDEDREALQASDR